MHIQGLLLQTALKVNYSVVRINVKIMNSATNVIYIVCTTKMKFQHNSNSTKCVTKLNWNVSILPFNVKNGNDYLQNASESISKHLFSQASVAGQMASKCSITYVVLVPRRCAYTNMCAHCRDNSFHLSSQVLLMSASYDSSQSVSWKLNSPLQDILPPCIYCKVWCPFTSKIASLLFDLKTTTFPLLSFSIPQPRTQYCSGCSAYPRNVSLIQDICIHIRIQHCGIHCMHII